MAYCGFGRGDIADDLAARECHCIGGFADGMEYRAHITHDRFLMLGVQGLPVIMSAR